jgi:CRISPR-associated protein Cst1
MDTVLDSYMYLNKEIPKLFIEGLENKTKFQTMGYSFLLGLQGEEYNNDNKNKGE